MSEVMREEAENNSGEIKDLPILTKWRIKAVRIIQVLQNLHKKGLPFSGSPFVITQREIYYAIFSLRYGPKSELLI